MGEPSPYGDGSLVLLSEGICYLDMRKEENSGFTNVPNEKLIIYDMGEIGEYRKRSTGGRLSLEFVRKWASISVTTGLSLPGGPVAHG